MGGGDQFGGIRTGRAGGLPRRMLGGRKGNREGGRDGGGNNISESCELGGSRRGTGGKRGRKQSVATHAGGGPKPRRESNTARAVPLEDDLEWGCSCGHVNKQ